MLRRVLKWIGVGVGVIVLVIAAALVTVYGVSSSRFGRRYAVNVQLPAAVAAGGSAERGAHVTIAVAKCVGCHGDDLGGAVMEDSPAFGRIVGPNLTRGRGGVGARYGPADWVRAVRHGVAPDGRALIFMPAHELRALSDRDLADVIAYVTSVPPVDRAMPPTRPGPVARTLYLTAGFPLVPADLIDHGAPPPAAPSPGHTVAYGAYLATAGGCTGCHGPKLDGVGGMPGARDLTPTSLGRWTLADFTRALREGRRPDGSPLSAEMPWRYTAKMSDDEIAALWLYLRALPRSGSAD
jgi:cytochrome c553